MIVKDHVMPLSGNRQVLHRFDNGYGASVIRGLHTYGGPEGLFEIAVIVWEGGEYSLTYDTPVTDDVLGYVDPEDVQGYLDQIEALPKKED